MKILKNWMVAMDFSEHDRYLLEYTHELAMAFAPEEIIFTYIMPRREIPARFIKEAPIKKEEYKKQLEEKVYAVFKDQAKVRCEIHEGTASFDLWRESHLHQTDLIIFGEKNIKEGRKIVPENFVRKSFCSVLFVPANPKPIRKIWVPVDFSDSSKDAVLFADELRSTYADAKIVCHHIFETPSIELVPKDMHEEYVQHFKENSVEEMKKFLAPLKMRALDFFCSPWIYAKPSDHIKEAAEESDADMIVMSSGGKSRLSAFVLGSNTIEMIQLEKNMPVLILKDKVERIRAWDILTNL